MPARIAGHEVRACLKHVAPTANCCFFRKITARLKNSAVISSNSCVLISERFKFRIALNNKGSPMRQSKTAPTAVALQNIKIGVKLLCAAAAVTSVLTVATPSSAQARVVTYELDIPSQNLNETLQSLAMTLRRKMLYSSELVSGKLSETLKGQFTAEQAFSTLLSGTGLTYELTSDGYVLIRKVGTSGSAGLNPSEGASTTLSDALSRMNGLLSPGAGETSAAVSAAETSSQSAKQPVALEEVVVTAQKKAEYQMEVPITCLTLRCLRRTA